MKRLNCDFNIISTISNLPPTLEYLECSDNKLTYLPPLPETLQCLNCSYNELYRLPPFPPLLTQLICAGCKLSMLPPLPTYLRYLCCAYNYLTFLPTLPPHLDDIECQCNELIRIPPIPDSVTRMNACHNQLMEYPLVIHVAKQDVHIFVDNNPLKEHVLDDESITIDNNIQVDMANVYMRHCNAVTKLYEIEQSQLRAQARCAAIKEQLMINRWHPSRVLYLLEAGYEIDDM